VKLVVDTNILFSFFKKESTTRTLILNDSLILISPEIALKELTKYTKELTRKSDINTEEFDEMILQLQRHITFKPVSHYQKSLRTALQLAQQFSQKDVEEFLDDVDFFALATKEKCSIWSKDTLFKKQSSIRIFTTKEIIIIMKSHK
jgi:predicted nucleic acid-binding protein